MLEARDHLEHGQIFASVGTVAAKGAALGAGLVTSTAKLGVAGARFVFAAGRQVADKIAEKTSDPTVLLSEYLQPIQARMHTPARARARRARRRAAGDMR